MDLMINWFLFEQRNPNVSKTLYMGNLVKPIDALHFTLLMLILEQYLYFMQEL